MLGEAIPKRRPRARLKRMCPDTHDAKASPGITSRFTRFKEEVDTALGPLQSTITVPEQPYAALSIDEFGQERIEPLKVCESAFGSTHIVT